MEPIPETRAVLDEMGQAGDPGLEGDLAALGRAARDIVPTCVGLSLAYLDEGLTFTLQATSAEVAELDAVQYLDGGPCVDAALHAESMDINESTLLDEGRWALFAQASAVAGVASSLTLPVVLRGDVIGTVNLYAATPDAFVGHHRALAEALGACSELAVTNADLTFSTRRTAMQAPTALHEQADIDIAIGMLAMSQDVDVETAAARLRDAALRAGISEVAAARTIRSLLAG